MWMYFLLDKVKVSLTGDLLYLMKHHKSIRQADFHRMILIADFVDVNRNLWGGGGAARLN